MKGFILVEVLVSILILSFLMVGIYGVLYAGSNTYHTSVGVVGLQQQARLAMDGLTRELRQARTSAINITSSDDISFSIPSETYGAVWIGPIRYYFDAVNNQIIREHPVGTEKIVANNVQSLDFSLNDGILDIRITCANRGAAQRDLSFTLEEQVRLRNE
jgi:type II secretory pathway component PulJ